MADDLVAETFVAAIAGRASYDPSRADPRAWLYGIATNLLKRHWRQEHRNLVSVSASMQLAGTQSTSGPDEDGVELQIIWRSSFGLSVVVLSNYLA